MSQRDRFLAWHCTVTPRADGRWSGRVALAGAGWTIGTGAGDRRVCRHASTTDLPIDANIGPEGDYGDVGAALPVRNFLVVRGSDACPDGRSIEQHQP